MARPRKQTYALETYLNSNRDGDISNNADTQRKPAWKPIIDGLIVTILTDDYIPPIILAEEENSQLNIVDGGSRTASFMMFRYGNHKMSAAVENSLIPYKKKDRDENGNIIWEDAFFDIKGKTYEQLPEELKKKFNVYQIETVIHENCDKNRIATYIKRYNEHSSMNTNQKAFTYMERFAKRVRKLMNSKFFVDCNVYSDNDNEKGVVERIIVETVMCISHFDGWSREAKKLFKYINDYGTEEEFDVLERNIDRLGEIITEDIRDIFDKKDSFIFLTLFDRFTKSGVEDNRFAAFLREFKKNYRGAVRNDRGLLYDEIKQNNSTKAKQVVIDKLELLEKMMSEFLRTKPVTEKQTVSDGTGRKTDDHASFIANALKVELNEVIERMDIYSEDLDSLAEKTIRDGSKILEAENRSSLLAMVAYSYENDVDLDEWLEQYAMKNNRYIKDQMKNFLCMKEDFRKYLKSKR